MQPSLIFVAKAGRNKNENHYAKMKIKQKNYFLTLSWFLSGTLQVQERLSWYERQKIEVLSLGLGLLASDTPINSRTSIVSH